MKIEKLGKNYYLTVRKGSRWNVPTSTFLVKCDRTLGRIGHITVPKELIGKKVRVKVIIEVINENKKRV